jgi:hypothetical protein
VGWYFKYFLLIAFGNSGPSKASSKYEFPGMTLGILYGTSQLGDHLPNLLFLDSNGKIIFETISPIWNDFFTTLLL